MKKLLSLLLVCLLACVFSGAMAEENLLVVDRMLAFCDQLLTDAMTKEVLSVEPYEDGGYVHTYDEYALYSPDQALTMLSPITGAALTNSDALLSDPYGVAPGHMLDELLDAYPLDNLNLQGTYSEAVLYIRGLLPGTVNTGRVIRDGSHALVVEHTVYAAEGDSVEKCCMVYTLENNFVTAVQLILNAQQMTVSEAQEELSALSTLQETDEYSVFFSETPDPLVREDLSFSGLDFLTVTPESAEATLGHAVSDTWAQDSEGFMRSMQWDDLQLVFGYDSNKENSYLMLLQVYGSDIEGPRNLHLGDSPESVLARFDRQFTSGDLLYGDGKTAPYGKYIAHDDGGVYILYAVAVENETVLLALSFIDNQLVDITCTYQ